MTIHIARSRAKKPSCKSRPLRASVSREGTLTIEIGIDTNAFAALRSEYVYSLMGPTQLRPDTRYRITDRREFAHDVIRELLDEAEDGSSMLTELFDKAYQRAIEAGSIAFVDDADGEISKRPRKTKP